MKATLISVTRTWICATGVALVSSYGIMTHFQNTPEGQKRATQVASGMSKRGTIPEYKPTNKHSSAVKKTTIAQVAKVVSRPTYVPNPLYPRFMNALDQLTEEVAAVAKDGDVALKGGFTLVNRDGKPQLTFPEAYGRVVIGGVAMGEEVKDWTTDVNRKRVNGPDQWKIEEVSLRGRRDRLDEPEFYCSRVTYSLLPATKQVDAIRMHGDLVVGNTSKVQAMVKEIHASRRCEEGGVLIYRGCRCRHMKSPREIRSRRASRSVMLDGGTIILLQYAYVTTYKVYIMSITLSMPPAVVQEVKAYANEHGTTMSQLTRDLYATVLTRKDPRRSGAASRFRALVAKAHVRSGWKFNRDEVNRRGSSEG